MPLELRFERSDAFGPQEGVLSFATGSSPDDLVRARPALAPESRFRDLSGRSEQGAPARSGRNAETTWSRDRPGSRGTSRGPTRSRRRQCPVGARLPPSPGRRCSGPGTGKHRGRDHVGMPLDDPLYRCGCEVLRVDPEPVILAAGEIDEPGFVPVSEVARPVPAVFDP